MDTQEKRTTQRLANVLWRRLPRAAERVSSTLRALLRDGDYLLTYPTLAAAAPVGAVLLGLLLGALHPGEVYSSSIIVLLVMALVAGLGAALGCWLGLGYALGDLLLHEADLLHGFSAALGSAVSYLVLLGLVALNPLLASGVRHQLQRRLGTSRGRRIAAFVIGGLLQGALAFLWAQSAAFLVRPVWSFSGNTPDTASIQPLQSGTLALVIATLVGVAARAWLTVTASDRRVPADEHVVRFAAPRTLPWPVMAALQALFFTILLSGLMGSVIEAALIWPVLVGIAVLRIRVVPSLTPYVRVIGRIPLLLRLAACCGLAYLMAFLLVTPAITRGTASFLPMIGAVLPPLILAALLLPGAPSRKPLQ